MLWHTLLIFRRLKSFTPSPEFLNRFNIGDDGVRPICLFCTVRAKGRTDRSFDDFIYEPLFVSLFCPLNSSLRGHFDTKLKKIVEASSPSIDLRRIVVFIRKHFEKQTAADDNRVEPSMVKNRHKKKSSTDSDLAGQNLLSSIVSR